MFNVYRNKSLVASFVLYAAAVGYAAQLCVDVGDYVECIEHDDDYMYGDSYDRIWSVQCAFFYHNTSSVISWEENYEDDYIHLSDLVFEDVTPTLAHIRPWQSVMGMDRARCEHRPRGRYGRKCYTGASAQVRRFAKRRLSHHARQVGKQLLQIDAEAA